jgi:hypothetical protein
MTPTAADAASTPADGAAASSAAARSRTNNGPATAADDSRLAREIRALDRLTAAFGFPHRLARAAIEECGPPPDDDDDDGDGGGFVASCYNWILDERGDEAIDGGGPVVPRSDCPHVARRVRFRIVGDDGVQVANDGGSPPPPPPPTTTATTTTTSATTAFATATRPPSTPEFPRPRPGNGDLTSLGCEHRDFDRRRRGRSRESGGGDPTAGRLKCDGDYEADVDRDHSAAEGDDGGGKRAPCPLGMNWLCLECGAVMCSRYANGHAKLHYDETKEEEEEEAIREAGGKVDDAARGVPAAEGHCVALCLADLSVWCYACNAYLRHPTLDLLTKYLEGLKFGDLDAIVVLTNRYCESIVIGRDFSYARSRRT